MEATGVCSKQCQRSTGVATANTACVAVNKLYHSLRSMFGFTEFRCGQLESMLPALHGNDAFVQMATGVGREVFMYVLGSTGVLGHSSWDYHQPTSLMDEQVTNIVP